jgi:hypothetical protein
MWFRLSIVCLIFRILFPISGAQAQMDPTKRKLKPTYSSDSSVIKQVDQARTVKQDTVVKKAEVKTPVHSPKKAALLSAVVPGAGQVYNRKYWKVGVLAAGTGALIYGLGFNQRNYTLFKDELIKRQKGEGGLDVNLEKYSNANLNELQDFYHRNRDLTIVGLALVYTLNIIDATVDAHLFDFNVNDDLSMHIRPQPVYSSILTFPAPGIGITMKF